jgi:hypothetical protein
MVVVVFSDGRRCLLSVRSCAIDYIVGCGLACRAIVFDHITISGHHKDRSEIDHCKSNVLGLFGIFDANDRLALMPFIAYDTTIEYGFQTQYVHVLQKTVVLACCHVHFGFLKEEATLLLLLLL